MKKVIVTVAILTVALGLWVSQSSYAAHSDRHCNGCHVPHWAVPESDTDYGVPLWSPTNTSDGLKYTYTMYSSKGMTTLGVSQAAQPDGPSKLCLGCHDGSYARIGDRMADPENYPDYKRGFAAEDLMRSHPISFIYDEGLAERSAGRLHNPKTTLSTLPGGRTISEDMLDSKEKMQCTSCHEVHKGGYDHYLRFDWRAEEEIVTNPDGTTTTLPRNDNIMCRVCHNK